MSTHSRLPRLTRSSSKITNAHNPFFPSRAKCSPVQFVGQVLLPSPRDFPSISFRMNTYKNRFHNSFRINTYKKEGEGGPHSGSLGIRRRVSIARAEQSTFAERFSSAVVRASPLNSLPSPIAPHYSQTTTPTTPLAVSSLHHSASKSK